ncbi:MAG: hypothetical protein R3296_06740 [Oleiphilaceae bacterium]|nr:hypothetical protein [Oleiphilaceae bacterium]
MKVNAVSRAARVRTLVVGLCFGLFSLSIQAQESLGTENASDRVFMSLSEKQQATVAAYLGRLLEESIGRAEQKIREQGSFVPFAYVGDRKGEGRFFKLSDDEKISAEVAAHSIQRGIVQSALKGDLVASVFYMTADGPEKLGKLRGDLEEGLEADQNLEDLRFLMVELQHLAGLSLLHVVPYWRNDGEWVFGKPQQRKVDPRLHQLVRTTIREYQQQQGQSQ